MCDGYRLDKRLVQEFGTGLIAPAKVNHRVHIQGSGPLRRYFQHCQIERLFSWPLSFRLQAALHDHPAANFQSLVHLAAAVMPWGSSMTRVEK
jgi:hypothetical protein